MPNVNAYSLDIAQTARNIFPLPGTALPFAPAWVRLHVRACGVTVSGGSYRRTGGN